MLSNKNHFGISTSLVAGPWNIRASIVITKELEIKNLIVEFDFRLAIDMLNRKCEIPLDVLVLIADCTAYSQGMNISFQNTYRKDNFCVDFLTNLDVKV